MSTFSWTVRRLHVVDDRQVDDLARVLVDCVEGGASVSVQSLSQERAGAFWRRVAEDVTAGRCALLVAEDVSGICGTVQLVLEQPENQPHRADVDARPSSWSSARARGGALASRGNERA